MDRKSSRNVDTLEGFYANYFEIGHNAFEFVLDFGQCYNANDEKVQLHTRIVTSPFYAEALLEMLQESVEQYKQHHGGIRESDEKAAQHRAKKALQQKRNNHRSITT